jgi:hypothetical protein
VSDDRALDGVDEAIMAHIFSGLPFGTAALREAAMLVGADMFELIVDGGGGHAGLAHETRDAVFAAARHRAADDHLAGDLAARDPAARRRVGGGRYCRKCCGQPGHTKGDPALVGHHRARPCPEPYGSNRRRSVCGPTGLLSTRRYRHHPSVAQRPRAHRHAESGGGQRRRKRSRSRSSAGQR